MSLKFQNLLLSKMSLPQVPHELIQICETHPDRSFTVTSKLMTNSLDNIQDQMPRWNLMTHTLQTRHPIATWLWLNDPLFRVSPESLRDRIILEAITEWQVRCATLDFPRAYSKKKALEGFGSMKPDLLQAKATMIAMERYMQDTPLLWILLNEKDKTLSFLDDKAFPKEGGYKHIWIIREPFWDRLWDASEWSSDTLVSWLEQQEKYVTVQWPLIPATESMTSMSSEYASMGFTVKGLSRDELRKRLSRAKAIRKLGSTPKLESTV